MGKPRFYKTQSIKGKNTCQQNAKHYRYNHVFTKRKVLWVNARVNKTQSINGTTTYLQNAKHYR